MRELTAEQRDIVCACILRPKLAIWADMGAGKTAITLHAIIELLRLGYIRRAVVVAPRAVADSTWRQEAELWPSTKSLRIQTLKGPAAKRREQAATPADVYCIGRDALAEKGARKGCIASQDLLALAYKAEDTLLVVDEASSIKNPSSSRFRALAYFRWGRVIELTGTPTPQSIADIWAQIYLLDRGEALGKTISAFHRQFMRKKFFGGFEMIEGMEERILDRVRPLILRAEVQPPCDVTYVDRYTPLSSSEAAAYDDFKTQMAAEIEGKTIEAVNAGALTSKLAAWASGGQYRIDEDERREVLRPHRRKREAMAEIFASDKSSFLVLYWFNFSIDDIKAAARAAGRRFEVFDSSKPDIVERWNRKEIDVLAAHPQSAGMGLNLQRGGNKELWVTIPWSSELWLQTVARLARRGQESSVEVIKLITPGTIDERISHVLGGKIDVQKLILDEIKGR